MAVHIRLLGPLEVDDGVAARSVGGAKERMLLALLALARGEFVSATTIADTLWRGDPPPSAAKSVQVLIARLRKALAAEPPIPVAIEFNAGAYRLQVPRDALDVAVVDDLVATARRAADAGEFEPALEALARAESLWRGPSLNDVADEPFATVEANRLEELRAAVREQRLEIEVQRGRHGELLGDLEAACATHPYRERLWWLRMLALHRSGRTADALRAYQEARRMFGDELGLEPGEELRALEAAILADDPALRFDDAARRPLPSGEITFVLTDVEGSTSLWERQPDRIAAALVRHDALIEEAISANGGILLKARGEGDSTFSVFGDAVSATRAIAAAQRAVADEPWDTEPPLRVRAAVHTGPAELRDNDYYGATINRAARLRGAGHGGQTLLSAASAALVRAELPPNSSLRDLGLRRLRDLREPEHIFQLDLEGLPSRFAPLAALDARPNNLPVELTSFVGRDDLVASVVSLLEGPARLVTLTGVGGIGKSRLALQCGAELIDSFDDGVWFVPLASLSEASGVLTAVATALGISSEPGTPLIDALRSGVETKRLLLIVDNFEHVLDAAPLVSDLLTAGPGVRVLATSREWLHLRGEQEVRVDVLSRESARAVFLERARAVRPDVDAWAEPAIVDDICARLDGLPLALELVAARMRDLDVRQVSSQLDTALDLATDGPRDQPARQRTLREALEWSVGLLDDAERNAFEGLSVFRADFSLPAAATVVGNDANVATLVVSLASKSLLVERAPGHFAMLATVKAYASERLAERADAHRDAMGNHVRWFAAQARAWFDAQGGLVEDFFDDLYEVGRLGPAEQGQLDDIRAAAGAARSGTADAAVLACQLASLVRGIDEAEAIACVERAGPAPDDEWRYWLGIARVSLLFLAHRYEEVVAVADSLIPLATAHGPRAAAEAWNHRGIGLWRLQRLEEAAAALEQSLVHAEPLGGNVAALTWHNLGLVAIDRGDLVDAERLFERADQVGDASLRFTIRTRRADIALQRGHWSAAIGLVGEMDEAPVVGSAVGLMVLVPAYEAKGETDRALEIARRVVARVADEGPPIFAQATAVHLGEAFLAAGDHIGARRSFDEVLNVVKDPVSRYRALRGLAVIAERDGELAKARDLAARAASEPRDDPATLVLLTSIEWKLGERATAWNRLAQVLRASVTPRNPLKCDVACRALADLASELGNAELAGLLLGAAERCRAEAGVDALAPGAPGERAIGAIDASSPAVALGRTLSFDDLLTRVEAAGQEIGGPSRD